MLPSGDCPKRGTGLFLFMAQPRVLSPFRTVAKKDVRIFFLLALPLDRFCGGGVVELGHLPGGFGRGRVVEGLGHRPALGIYAGEWQDPLLDRWQLCMAALEHAY